MLWTSFEKRRKSEMITGKKYELLIRTALQRSPRQLGGIVERKFRNRVLPRIPVNFDGRYAARVPDDLVLQPEPHGVVLQQLQNALTKQVRKSYRDRTLEFLEGSVTFLNRRRQIDEPGTVRPDDSRLEGLPRLWYLKLAGFTPLEWAMLGFDESKSMANGPERFDTWIRTFANEQRIGMDTGYLRGAWTPYAVCHRIITLTKYAVWHNGLEKKAVEFLYKNLLFLDKHVEEDVGGNHLIENGAALVAGGLVFAKYGNRFVRRGIEILQQACSKQFLEDGYHYERSPMYHIAVTERLISICLLLDAADRSIPEQVHETAAQAHAFIEHLTASDSDIPLLNDSVYGEALSPMACSRYGRSAALADQANPELDASGLVWIQQDSGMLLADFGASGPENLLAHTHNDPFTICVWVDEQPVITDTGTFDYQSGKRRQRSRSIRAHNTAHPKGVEPVEFGGRFLMADRLNPTISMNGTNRRVLSGEYTAPDANYSHQRTIIEGPDWWFIWDVLDSNSTIVSRLHSAPGIDINIDTPIQFVEKGESRLQVHPIQTDSFSVKSTPYFPEFGVEKQRDSLVLYSDNRAIGYLLGLGQPESVSVTTDGSELRGVRVDGKQFKIPEVDL